MRVEKLELSGFKSFGERTVFNLHPGITCIVGPNGCGKSNVVDSFKWVLGEQSPKSLRGGKMEEVIFAGSQNKKPKGMGEVSLHVSGLGGAGNGGDATTTVTRRLYRSGDSDYMINRASCRLRDIKDIFLDTGLEMKSYSILEQDRISAILSARPDERRFLIEEVAGVVKYKVRRNEAQSKLDSSRANIQRITDIVAEVRRQINSLDRQVKKAERYKRLAGELREIELWLAKSELVALSSELEGILARHGEMKEEDALLRAELSGAEAEIESRRMEMLDREKALEALSAELHGVEMRMAEAERGLAVSKTEVDNLKEYSHKLRAQEEENVQKTAQAKFRLAEAEEATGAFRAEAEALEAELARRAEALSLAEGQISDREGRLEDMRRQAFDASETLGRLRGEQEKFAASLENLGAKGASLERETEEIRAVLDEAEEGARSLEQSIVGKNGELLALRDQKLALAASIAEIGERLEALRAETAGAREDLASASSRMESLEEMVFSESSEEALREHVSLTASVSDVIEVGKEHERAVEAALGELVSGFIVKGYGEVKDAAGKLREKGLGRTGFLPLDVTPSAGAPELPEGALSRLSDVVRVREEFAGALGGLLKAVVLVRDLESAIALRRPGLTLVTPEGEVVHPSGAVTAGLSRGILPLKRQIRELAEAIEGKRARVEGLERQAAEAALALGEKRAALEEASLREAEAEKEVSLLRLRAERHSEDIERAGRKLSVLRLEAEEVEREMQSLRALIDEKEAEVACAGLSRTTTDEAVSSTQAEISHLRAGLEQRRAEAVEARLKLNSLTERQGALEAERKSLALFLEELSEKEAFIKGEAERTAGRISRKEEEASRTEESLRALAVRAGELGSRAGAMRDALADESEALLEKEKGVRALRQKIDECSQRLSELDVKRAERSLMIDNLKANVKGAHGVDLDRHETGPPEDGDPERRSELKAKIESLGPVSLGSLDEYEELKARHDFLAKQQEDLQRSIAELEEAIKRINSTTRKRLREAYDALKAKFSEVFVELFGGGRAELVLTDEDNILDTGIDVVAQPPGKRFQNISLLSGGEKSLTALALLFASFLIKPTPLCILDEADAALDETNTHKFAAMLKGLSKEIQFIVITHNRVTMEAADYIYGITMEEPGISRVISMQFAQA